MDNQEDLIEMLAQVQQEMKMLSSCINRIDATINMYLKKSQEKQILEYDVPKKYLSIKDNWMNIISKASSQRFREVLSKAKLYWHPAMPEQLVVAFTSFLGESYVGNPERTTELEVIIEKELGISVTIKMALEEEITSAIKNMVPIEDWQ